MEDFPAKVADLLELVASRIRNLTVERVAGWARWTAIGTVLAIIGSLILIFVLIGGFRLIAGLITVEGAYALFGAIFIIFGIFLWSMRLPKSDESTLAQ